MFSTLMSFVVNHWRDIIVAIVFSFLVSVLFYLQYTIQGLNKENQSLTYQLSLAQQQIDGLNVSISSVRVELESSNTLLNECYANIEQRTKDLTEIEQIMSIKTKYLTSSTDIKEEEESQSYDLINPQVNEAGLDFINRKYSTLR